jgi:hypothetical protein
LSEFGCPDTIIEHPALNMDQIEEFNPPTNPTKISDPRAGWYLDVFGDDCWELDALPPKELVRIITDSVSKHVDIDLFNSMVEREDAQKEVILKYANRYKE